MPFSSVLGANSVVKPGVCTSSTKPASPYDGQVIYMTDADQTAVWDGSSWVVLAPIASGRNVVINGAMQVAQRGTSTASITTGGIYTADRYTLSINSLGTWTQSVENDAPTGSGFRKSLKLNCTTADASPAAGDYMLIEHRLEGQNIQQFLKGTASAKQFTLSFWVKSNVTGTYIVELLDNDNSRQVSASYTVNTSATWEKKTLTFPVDTTGAFDNDNAYSLGVDFFLGLGSNFTSGTLNTSWASITNANRGVGQTNLASATNNYWQVTGVQLEAGAVATPFEFEDYSVTLAKCQRYYYQILAASDAVNTVFAMGSCVAANLVSTYVPFKVTMRTTPNLNAASGTNYYDFAKGSSDNFNSLTLNLANEQGARLYNNSEISQSDNAVGELRKNNAAAYVAFTAEL